MRLQQILPLWLRQVIEWRSRDISELVGDLSRFGRENSIPVSEQELQTIELNLAEAEILLAELERSL